MMAVLRNIWYARKHRGEINHITGDVQYIAIGTGRNSILTIHDIKSAFQGNWIKCVYVWLFWFLIPLLIVKKVTVISETTKTDLLKLFPWCRKKVEVIPNPYNSAFSPSPMPQHNNHRILHIGTKTNKNLERVIQSLEGIDCTLIIIGTLAEKQIRLLRNAKILYENYIDLSRNDLIKEYHKCDVVSFPSIFEGFGMPVIEGQAIGRPVIAGDIPVLRDVAGLDGALFVNPYEYKSIRAGFQELFNNHELCIRLRNNGLKNIIRYEPQAIAQRYLKLYSQI